MENIAFAVFLYFLVTVLMGGKKKRKPSPPGQMELPPQPGDREAPRIDFEIPHLEGAPPLPSLDAIQREAPSSEPPLRQRSPSAERETLPARDAAPVADGQPAGKACPILLEPQTAMQAIAMAEILNRPKAYRNLHRR